MEKENVLEIETQEVFDKVAIRIKYQNFEVLKRGEFEDKEIKVISAWTPQYIAYDNKLYIQGKEIDEDTKILLVDKKDLEKIMNKINKINEKYGILYRWRAASHERFFCIYANGEVSTTQDDYGSYKESFYELGNYFKTEEEAQKVIDSKEWQEFWEKVRNGEIGNE